MLKNTLWPSGKFRGEIETDIIGFNPDGVERAIEVNGRWPTVKLGEIVFEGGCKSKIFANEFILFFGFF